MKEIIKKTPFPEKVKQIVTTKVLAWIILIFSIVAIINYVYIFLQTNIILLGIAVSILGIIASLYIFKENKVGIICAIIWSLLQVIILQIGNFAIDFSQFFKLYLSLNISDMETIFIIEINVLALLLFYISYIHKDTFSNKKELKSSEATQN